MPRSYFAAVILHLVCTLGVFTPARVDASLVVALSSEQMADEADSIVVGTIGTQHSEMLEHGRIITRTEIIVSDTIKNSSRETVQTFVTLGGQIGDLAMSVAGAPTFTTGERVVLFLRRGGSPEFQVLGMAQGAFHVRRINGVDVVKQDLFNLELVGPRASAVSNPRLSDFLAGIRARVASKANRNQP